VTTEPERVTFEIMTSRYFARKLEGNVKLSLIEGMKAICGIFMYVFVYMRAYNI